MSIFFDAKQKPEGFLKTIEEIGKGTVSVVGLTPGAKSHFAAFLCKHLNKQGIFITDSDYSAKHLAESLAFYLPDCAFYYPSKELAFFKADAKSNELENQRLAVLERLAEGEHLSVTVMSIDAMLQFAVDLSRYKEQVLKVCVGSTLDMQDTIKRLADMGYVREDMVEGKGQFSVRGGILDVFPTSAENPYRIELFGDEVDSIRTFDVFTQVSVENAETVKIGLAAETVTQKVTNTCVLQYFQDDAIVFYDEPKAISLRAEGFLWDIEETVKALAEKDKNFQFQDAYILNYFDVLKTLLTHPFVALSELPCQVTEFSVITQHHIA
ncbi:MAG: hypothetical protein J6Q27_04190, partial [Clostridia bacterium]|nr:hypothetical protein [Clostridia bacterium]